MVGVVSGGCVCVYSGWWWLVVCLERNRSASKFTEICPWREETGKFFRFIYMLVVTGGNMGRHEIHLRLGWFGTRV